MRAATSWPAPAPERSVAQRMDALERANGVRSFRKDRKLELKAGSASARASLFDGEPELATMKVWDLLMATPKVGRVKANRYLREARISPSKTIGGLTERQRRELAAICPQLR